MITAYYTEADIENIGAGLIFGASNNRLYIATADHVVRPKVRRKIVAADSIMVQFRSLPGEMFKAVLQPDSDEILDLAVRRIEDWEEKGIDIGGVPFNFLGEPGKLNRGADVFHVGNPMGQSWHTNVKADKISENIGNFLSFESNFIATGHSGGGLFNECWDLVGMLISDQPP